MTSQGLMPARNVGHRPGNFDSGHFELFNAMTTKTSIPRRHQAL